MKRIAILCLTLVFALVLSIFAVSAAETDYDLIPDTDDWTIEKYGQVCEMTVTNNDDGSVVFAGTAAWPSATTYYEEPITVAVDSTSLVFDFSFTTGYTNISFFFKDASDNNYVYTLCNTAMGEDVIFDTGSGDLAAGEYKMTMKLSDLVASTKLLVPEGAEKGEAFPADAIVDGNLTFTGVQVFATSGASVTVKELKLVSETANEPTESSDENTSSEVSVESSEEVTSSAEATSSETVTSSESSKAPATGDSSFIVFAVLAVVAIAGVAVVAKVRR